MNLRRALLAAAAATMATAAFAPAAHAWTQFSFSTQSGTPSSLVEVDATAAHTRLEVVRGATLLGHAVTAVAALSPEHLAVVVGHGRDQVCSEVDALAGQLGRPVVIAVQEQQLGTGHAVRCGLEALPSGLAGAVVVTYGDVPLLEPGTMQALLAEHTATGAAVTLLTAELADPTGYGRVLRGADGGVTGIVEHAYTPERPCPAA